MICGSCGMRMDGARRARLQGADAADRRGGPRAGDLGDGEPADRQGPRRRHGAVLAEDARDEAVARSPATSEPPEEKEFLVSQERDGRDPQGGALHQLRLLRLRVQLDGVRPRVPRAGRAREGHALRRRRRATRRRSSGSRTTTPSTGSGTARAATSAHERCPKGVDPRDAIAKLGAESIKHGIDRDMGAKHANWFVTSAKTTGWLRETELVPKTQGVVSSIKEIEVRDEPGQEGQGAAAVPAARRRERQGGARALQPGQGAGPRRRRRASSRASSALAHIEFAERPPDRQRDRGRRTSR